MSVKIYVDTHIHIYPDYNVELLLDSALTNFKRFSLGGHKYHFVLGLTERFDCNFFRTHKDASTKYGNWELKYNPEIELLVAKNGENRLNLLPGRQNISSEKIEILTLGSDLFRAEGLPAFEIIKGSEETGLITVLPWSFGKWMGKRGKLIEKLMDDSSLDFVLGDPAHRFGPKPKLFIKARESKRPIFAGTDPLPLEGEENRVAAYGTIFDSEEGEINAQRILKSMVSKSTQFGSTEDTVTGVKLQLRMRMKK